MLIPYFIHAIKSGISHSKPSKTFLVAITPWMCSTFVLRWVALNQTIATVSLDQTIQLRVNAVDSALKNDISKTDFQRTVLIAKRGKLPSAFVLLRGGVSQKKYHVF